MTWPRSVRFMTVYIAGPMTGLPKQNYPAFNAAAARLRALGYEVLNPVDSEAENHKKGPQSHAWYMRRAVRMVSHADGIALLPGWEKSAGAALEVQIGRALELEIQTLGGWV